MSYHKLSISHANSISHFEMMRTQQMIGEKMLSPITFFELHTAEQRIFESGFFVRLFDHVILVLADPCTSDLFCFLIFLVQMFAGGNPVQT